MGYPKQLPVEQAKSVDGEFINELCNHLGLSKRHSSPYHLEGDGQVVKSLQTIKILLFLHIQDDEKLQTDETKGDNQNSTS